MQVDSTLKHWKIVNHQGNKVYACKYCQHNDTDLKNLSEHTVSHRKKSKKTTTVTSKGIQFSSQDSLEAFSQEKVILLETLNLEQVRHLNKDILRATDLGLQNKLNMATKLLESKADLDAFHAIGAGLLWFAKGAHTFNKKEVQRGHEYLEQAIQVANSQNPDKGFKIMTRSYNWRTARCALITAASHLVIAGAYLFQENISGLVKAGLSVTKGHSQMETIFKWYKGLSKKEQKADLDETTKGGILFITSVINFVIGILPESILRLISVLGYTSDMDLAWELMTECEKGDDFFSYIAPFFFLGLDALTAFFAPRMQTIKQKKETDSRLKGLDTYSDFIGITFIKIHLCLNNRKVDQAEKYARSSITCQKDWPGLADLGKLEMVLVMLIKGDWKSAYKVCKDLMKTPLYALVLCYAKSAAQDMMNEEGVEYMDTFNQPPLPRIVGFVLPPEVFVSKRVIYFESLSSAEERRLHLPSFEILHLFQGFDSMPIDRLEECLKIVDTAKTKAVEFQNKQLDTLLNLYKACILRNINTCNNIHPCDEILFLLENVSNHKEINWLKPSSLYEQARTYIDAYLISKNKKFLTKAKDTLKQVLNIKKYTLEELLVVKVNIVLQQLKALEQEMQ